MLGTLHKKGKNPFRGLEGLIAVSSGHHLIWRSYCENFIYVLWCSISHGDAPLRLRQNLATITGLLYITARGLVERCPFHPQWFNEIKRTENFKLVSIFY